MENKIKGDNNNVIQIDKLFINQGIHDNIILDERAVKLLKEAIEDEKNPRIIYVKAFSGRTIQCGSSRFSVNSEQMGEREMSYWESSLNDLIKYEFIEDVGYKNEVFKVTKRGYEYYDDIN